MYKIVAIVAADPNGGIGINGKLPWNIKEDLQWFKTNTLDKYCVSSKSLYNKDLKGLTGRHWIALSSKPEGMSIPEYNYNYHTPITIAEDLKSDIMIVGGPKVYEWAMPYLTDVLFTGIKQEYECDAFIDLDKLFKNKYCYTSLDTSKTHKFTMWRKYEAGRDRYKQFNTNL